MQLLKSQRAMDTKQLIQFLTQQQMVVNEQTQKQETRVHEMMNLHLQQAKAQVAASQT